MGISAAGSVHAPHVASSAYAVIPMTGRAILRLSPIAVVLVAAACGGGGGGGGKPAIITRLPQARIYLVRDGKLAPVERGVEKLDDPHVLQALKQGPTSDERQLGFTA